jgi:lysophospholipase L1-like esterase
MQAWLLLEPVQRSRLPCTSCCLAILPGGAPMLVAEPSGLAGRPRSTAFCALTESHPPDGAAVTRYDASSKAQGLPAGGTDSDVIRLAALGDSTTAGFGDPTSDGRWRGWAALLAESLGPHVAFTNFARSGAITASVACEQQRAAVMFRPTVAVVPVGINDTLRKSFDASGVAANLDRVVGELTAIGAIVLTACLPDPALMFGLPPFLGRPLARRVAAVNAALHMVADRYASVHLHTPDLPGVYDAQMWSVDRLHPGERGHRLLAAGAFDLLAAWGVPVWRRPALEPTNRPPTRSQQAVWLATHGTRWLLARSTDLLPELARLVVAELWGDLRVRLGAQAASR